MIGPQTAFLKVDRLLADAGVSVPKIAAENHDDSGQWFRAYGNENWAFDEHGLMHTRHASINEHPISEVERQFRWPLGRRPDDHPGLDELGL